MESCCLYICSVGPIEDCCVMLLPRFHPHESAWWAPLNRFYAGLAGFARTCIGPILRVLHRGSCPPRGFDDLVAVLLIFSPLRSNKNSITTLPACNTICASLGGVLAQEG